MRFPVVILVLLVALGNLHVTSARPDAPAPVKHALTLQDRKGYEEYVTKFNPFNGTDATFLYSDSKPLMGPSPSLSTGASNSSARSTARLNLSYCFGGFLSYGGLGCMYDSSARVSFACLCPCIMQLGVCSSLQPEVD